MSVDNLRPSTYDGYKRTIKSYIVPYIGHVPLNQLAPSMVDKMFQQIIDKGLKPSTAAGAKRVLSVALGHARKYRYIETNAARDTLTKFGKSDKTPDPYTPEQVRVLMERVAGTEWEMPVVLGGLYGMRRSEVLGLRWKNVDLENGTFDVVEQLPFHVPPKTTVIEEWHRPSQTGGDSRSRTLRVRSLKSSRRRKRKRLNRPDDHTMTTTLLWQKKTAHHKLQTGFPPALANCWPNWICHTYATTIYVIARPRTCTSSPEISIQWVKCWATPSPVLARRWACQ